jgi:hypothetical protein
MKPVMVAYVIAIHVLCVMLLFNTDFLDRVRTKAILLGVVDPFIPANSVVLLGDSITLALPETFTDAINLGVLGLNSKQLLETLPRLKSLQRYRACKRELRRGLRRSPRRYPGPLQSYGVW